MDGKDEKMGVINRRHRYLVKRNSDGAYIGSTNNLGATDTLPIGHVLVDTIGTDGLGSINGNRGIPAFLRAKERGVRP